MNDWDDINETARVVLKTLLHKGDDMADLIERLEDQLEEAVEALGIADKLLEDLGVYADAYPDLVPCSKVVRATLKYLKGEN